MTELIIVIVVVAILASITIVAYGNTQATARDARRTSDLTKIGEAIQLYRQKYGDDVAKFTLPDSGAIVQCGSGASGSGWINYATDNPGDYQYSILKCLKTAGYLDGSGEFVDPFNCSTSSGSVQGLPPGTTCQRQPFAYMKYTSGTPPNQITCLYARLETRDDSAKLKDTSNANPCRNNNSAAAADTYKMNYMLLVD